MVHEMNLQSIYFDKIKNNEKIYEIRLNDEKRQLIDVGDIIIFRRNENKDDKFQVIVKDLIYFKSFDELLDTLPIEKMGFNSMKKEDVKQIYRQFYSVEKENKYGVVAIKVKVC